MSYTQADESVKDKPARPDPLVLIMVQCLRDDGEIIVQNVSGCGTAEFERTKQLLMNELCEPVEYNINGSDAGSVRVKVGRKNHDFHLLKVIDWNEDGEITDPNRS